MLVRRGRIHPATRRHHGRFQYLDRGALPIPLVENDIDPTDLRDVMWALASRVRPGSDFVVEDRPIFNLSPLYTPPEREITTAR
jgi:hypothetical protein